MNNQDPIADMLTRIRNANRVGRRFVQIPKSKICTGIAQVLKDEGYIEEFDSIVPRLLELGPQVLAVTGDHSTPARMKQHSWHSVPAVVHAPENARPDGRSQFGEGACRAGTQGHRPMSELMSLLLAHAGRLTKYGA